MGTAQLLALQVRVIAVLVLRETRATFGSSSFGYIWALLTPSAGVGLLVFIFSLVGRQPPYGASLALFFASGILALQLFNELSNKLMTVFAANRALLTYPIIKDVDTLLARAVLIFLTYFLIMSAFYAILLLSGLAELPARPGHLLLAYLATAILGFGFGTFNAVIFSLWETWIQVEKVLTRPLFFVSGIFYVPSQLPPEARDVLYWNPVLHLVEWFRHGLYPSYNSLVLDMWYPIYVGVFLTLLGLAGERFLRRTRY
jgi:capsular polysaccharide transport system permease protein